MFVYKYRYIYITNESLNFRLDSRLGGHDNHAYVQKYDLGRYVAAAAFDLAVPTLLKFNILPLSGQSSPPPLPHISMYLM